MIDPKKKIEIIVSSRQRGKNLAMLRVFNKFMDDNPDARAAWVHGDRIEITENAEFEDVTPRYLTK